MPLPPPGRTHLDPNLEEQDGNQRPKQLPAEASEPVDAGTCTTQRQQQAHEGRPYADPATPGQVETGAQPWSVLGKPGEPGRGQKGEQGGDTTAGVGREAAASRVLCRALCWACDHTGVCGWSECDEQERCAWSDDKSHAESTSIGSRRCPALLEAAEPASGCSWVSLTSTGSRK